MNEHVRHLKVQSQDRLAGMRAVPGGRYVIGSDTHYREEAPAHPVHVDDFLIDIAPITNRQFRDFVRDTGHVTVAERIPDAKDYPGALPGMLYAGSLVFRKTAGPVDLRDPGQWWSFTKSADWRHPYGPESSLRGRWDHPVVHVAYEDALAYAHWAGKDLPTEAEWEVAARGGLDRAEYAWGDDWSPEDLAMANTWQGEFPHENLATDGYEGTSPVRSFPPNGYGLYDMIGNVWEWTSDFWSDRHPPSSDSPCCLPRNPRGGSEKGSLDPSQPAIRIPRRVLKSGSHLCAPNYCRRYRPAARHAEAVDTSTSHVGFRCVVRGGGSA